MKVGILTIVGGSLGFGHLRRMLTLAGAATTRDFEVSHLLFSEQANLDPASSFAEREAGTSQVFALQSLYNGHDSIDDGWSQRAQAFDYLILDISHGAVLKYAREVEKSLDQVLQSNTKIFVIDSPGDQALFTRLVRPENYIFFYPYANRIDFDNSNGNIIQGAQYAILDQIYARHSSRSIRKNADRILITFGGSDPEGLSIPSLIALNSITEPLQVKIIIGPLFRPEIKKEIQARADASSHRVTLIESPEDLSDELLWADLSISASGLTKYELAATGTPAILISIDDVHDRLNQDFMKLGSAIDLHLNRDPDIIAKTVLGLLHDVEKRNALSQAGRAAIDGRGVSRILERIQNESK